MAEKIESQFGSSQPSHLKSFVRQQTLQKIESKGSEPGQYDIYAIRKDANLGDEILGPTPLHVGRFSEKALYGAAGSPVMHFRSSIQELKNQAERAASFDQESIDYGYHAALVWANVGRLKDFIGASPIITEIVAELRTARFQFLGKDTPVAAMQALAEGLALVAKAPRLDSLLVDKLVNILEKGGIDSLAQDALRNAHA